MSEAKISSTLTPLAMETQVDDTGKTAKRVKKIFKGISWFVIACAMCFILYWCFASDRYVSEAIVLVQNTDNVAGASNDVVSMVSALGGPNKTDQLLVREHLLSVDMLKKLDKALNLRAHYASTDHDFISRLWWHDISLEWFHFYYKLRVSVTYDEYSGVLRISTQAFDPQMAEAITKMLVDEGERFMNDMSHRLAQAQVDFLVQEVKNSEKAMREANRALLNFQNHKGLESPKLVVKNLTEIIAGLEADRTKIQTKLASLPGNLDANHPTKKAMRQSLLAVEQQIKRERIKLASIEGKPLNALAEEEQLLELDAGLKQNLYKVALAALERGRMDAARSIKQVSVLQQPVTPEYAWEPRRTYGVIATIVTMLLVLGIVNLLRSVILDHVD